MKQPDIILLESIVGICVLGAAVGAGGYALYGKSKDEAEMQKTTEDTKHKESPLEDQPYNIRVDDDLTHICLFKQNNFHKMLTIDFKKNQLTWYHDFDIYNKQSSDQVQLLHITPSTQILNEYVLLQNPPMNFFLCKVVKLDPDPKYLKMFEIDQDQDNNIKKCVKSEEFIPKKNVKYLFLGEMTVPTSGGKRKTRHSRRSKK